MDKDETEQYHRKSWGAVQPIVQVMKKFSKSKKYWKSVNYLKEFSVMAVETTSGYE